MRIDTEADLSRALEALAAICPLMAGTLKELGPPPLRRRPPGFEGLIQIVVFQQISVDAGRAIWARFIAAFGTPTPQMIRDAGDEALRAAGLSRPKVRAMQAMADAVLEGSLRLDDLDERPADEAHAHLVAIKGIGPWTADVYLLSCLGHPDAWPAGDIALQAAAGELLGLPARPSARDMGPLAERWRPWRAVAARLLWAHYGARRSGRVLEPLVITT